MPLKILSILVFEDFEKFLKLIYFIFLQPLNIPSIVVTEVVSKFDISNEINDSHF